METKTRCAWCEKDDLYRNYHDNEWGKPVYDDATIFEFLILETFQAGLSWYTVLAKRENFRKAFDQFDYHKIANYKEIKIAELAEDKRMYHLLEHIGTKPNVFYHVKVTNDK